MSITVTYGCLPGTVLTHSPLTAATRVWYPVCACEMVLWSSSQTGGFPPGTPVSSNTKTIQTQTSVPTSMINISCCLLFVVLLSLIWSNIDLSSSWTLTVSHSLYHISNHVIYSPNEYLYITLVYYNMRWDFYLMLVVKTIVYETQSEMCFKGCDSNFEVNILLIIKVATNETSTLH